MKIEINTDIINQLTSKINDFYEVNRTFPSKITLSSDQYRDLWLVTYYTWTRNLNKPHTITHYGGMEISIGLVDEIICE